MTCSERVLSPADLCGSIRALRRIRHQLSRSLDRPLRIRMESKRDGGYCCFSHPHAVTSSLLRSLNHSFSHALTHQFPRKLSHPLTQFPTQKYLHQIPSFIQFTLYHIQPLLHSLFTPSINTSCHSFIQPLQPPYTFIHSIVTHFAAPSFPYSPSCIFTLPHSIPSSTDHFSNAAVFPSMMYLVTPYSINATVYLCSVTLYHL